MQFLTWCSEAEETISNHVLRKLTADPLKNDLAVTTVAARVPDYYVDPGRVAGILKRLGKPAAANYVQQKLPTTPSIRSGDLAEILCNAYVVDATMFKLGIKRLRWKDHRNMSMRGEDVLGFTLSKSGALKVLKVEVKSRTSMTTAVIDEARTALSSNNGLPSPHAVSFVADRAIEDGDVALGNAIDDAQLKGGIRTAQVSHLLFCFSGNDPSTMLKTNLNAYGGAMRQYYVTLRVQKHQDFIKAVFAALNK